MSKHLPSPNSTFLYRHFDADGRLLYVGISLQAIARLSGHRQTARWAHLICRVEIEAFPSRKLALQAEKDAIEFEQPMYNTLRSAEGIGDNSKQAYRTVNDERRALWPSCVERRYGISAPTRWRWERSGRLPPRDIDLGGKTGWRPETLDAAELKQQVA